MNQQFKLQEVLRILSKDEAKSIKRLPNEMDLPWGSSSLGLGAAVALPQAFTSFMAKTVVRMRLGAPWVWSPPDNNGIVQVSRDSSIFDREDTEKKRMLVPFPLKVSLFGKLPDTREEAAAIISCLVTWGGHKQVERTSDAIQALVEDGLEKISRSHDGELASAIRDNESAVTSDLASLINKNGLGVEEVLLEPFRVGPDRINLDGRKGGVVTVRCKNEWKRRLFNYQAQLEWSDTPDHQVASYLYRGSIENSDTASGATMLLADQLEPVEQWLRQLIVDMLSEVEWSEAEGLIADSKKLSALISRKLGLGTGRKVSWMQIEESDKQADRRFGDVYRFEGQYSTQDKDQPIIFSHVVEYRVDDPELLKDKKVPQSKPEIEKLIARKVKEWTRIWVTRRNYTEILEIMVDEDEGQKQIREDIGHLVRQYFDDFGIEITNFEALTSIPGFEFKQAGGVRLDLDEVEYNLSDPSGKVKLAVEAAVFADSKAGRRFERHLFEGDGKKLKDKAKETVQNAVARVLSQVETKQFYRSQYVYGKDIPISNNDQGSATANNENLITDDTHHTLPDILSEAINNALDEELGLKLKPESLYLRISNSDELMQRMLEITGRPIIYDQVQPLAYDRNREKAVLDLDESQAATAIHLKAELLATDICLDNNRTFLNAFKLNDDAEGHINGIKDLIASAHHSLTLANLDPEHLLNPQQQQKICAILSDGLVKRAENSHGVKLQVNSMFISVWQPNKRSNLIETEKMLINKMTSVKADLIEKLGNPFEDEDDVEALRRSEKILEDELEKVSTRHRSHRQAEAGLELNQELSGGAIEFKPTVNDGTVEDGMGPDSPPAAMEPTSNPDPTDNPPSEDATSD